MTYGGFDYDKNDQHLDKRKFQPGNMEDGNDDVDDDYKRCTLYT